MARQATRAVLLDALGTLVELQPPAPRLRALLAAEGFEIGEERAAEAFAAEIAYYLDHHLEGRDAESLDALRDDCAGVLLDALGVPGLDHATARRGMLGAIRFEAYPDAVPALGALRAAGLRLAVASNWDCSLPDRLREIGLLNLVDGVVTSAGVGADKPAPAVFGAALAIAGARPEQAMHVGDSPDKDVAGARAAGIRPVLLVRDGDPAPPDGVRVVASLGEVLSLV